MKILLATDGSEHSEEAARLLSKFCFSKEDKINILHAISWVPAGIEWNALFSNFKEIEDNIVPKILDTAADILKSAKASICTSFQEDFPDKAILEAADKMPADLIVMGARGLKGIKSQIVGSSTKLVAINSKSPVLIVKPAEDPPAERIKVLLAVDGSAYSETMCSTLSSLPFPDNSEIAVLNVVPTVFEDIPDRFAIEINDRMKRIIADAREKESKASDEVIDKACKALSSNFVNVDKIVKHGDPSVTILETADELKAEIIAVGTSGMRGVKGMLGSVSRYILNHADCSVLIGH